VNGHQNGGLLYSVLEMVCNENNRDLPHLNAK